MADRMDSTASLAARMGRMAQTVRARRKALGLTQIALSQLAGCGPDFVYDVEVGKTTLRLDKLVELLNVLGLELVLSEGKEGLRVVSTLALPEQPAPKKGSKRRPRSQSRSKKARAR